MTKFLKFLAVLTQAAVLVACGGSKTREAPASGGGDGKPGASDVSKATDEIPTADRKEMYLDRYRFGIAADSDGIVVKESDWVPAGSTVFISMYLRNAPTGSELRIVWNDVAAKKAVGDAITKPVGDKGLVTFQQTAPLPNGSYRAELFFRHPGAEWQDLGGHEFTVGTKS